MAQEPVVIPEKIYFKIGEVCDLVGVQAHVLRYWETEFSMLSPQKNKSGQRSYRRRDVEMALRIKQLLYNEMFTIAGAKKKLQSEIREGSKAKAPTAPPVQQTSSRDSDTPTLFDNGYDAELPAITAASASNSNISHTGEQHDALKTLATNLLELRDILKSSRVS